MHVSTISAASTVSAIIARADLAAAMPTILEAVEKRNTTPILGTVRITADGDGALLTGSNLDLEIRVRIPGAIDDRFGLCLDAHKLGELLKKAPTAEYVAIAQPEFPSPSFTKEGHPISRTMKADTDFERVTFGLPAEPVDDFPAGLGFNGSHSFTMSGAELRDHIAAVAGGISTEETRYYLNGIYMHFRDYDGVLTFVATDGHRLYRQDAGAPEGAEGMPGIIIPKGTISTLLKLLKGKACPAEVRVDVSDSRVSFRFGAVEIRSKVIDGTFPDYQRVIPLHNDRIAMVDTAQLQDSLAGVLAISDQKGRAVKMVFGDDVVSLHVNDPDNGTARTDCPVASYEGDPMEIGFNGKYLGAILDLCGKSTTIALADSGSPTLFHGDRTGWMAVLMPLRV
jgi:DNA polymerase-3 subunit beta